MSIRISRHNDHAALGAAVADRIIALVKENPEAVIGLATGATPEPIYADIVASCREAAREGHPIDFSRVTFFALDEYVGLPHDNRHSYHYYLWHKLLGPIGADPTRVHIPNGNAANLKEECELYEAELKKAGKVDLWIVGLGRNGHIGFNEPFTPFDSRTRRVRLDDSTIKANSCYFFGQNPPCEALTVGLATLREYAKEIALVVNGEAKQDILSKLLSSGVTNKLPASLLKTMPTIAYADDAALAKYERQRNVG